ncbi:MAG: trypsin-like peptidase domain-containing protein [Tepidiformaceae bacterium]
MADTTSNTLTGLSEAFADAVERAGISTVLVNARRRIPASGIIWTSDGAILTSDHVIEREEEITVTFADGRELPAAIVGRDPGSDLAVLKVAGEGFSAAERVAEGSARVGNLVLALGRPTAGSPMMASLGVISAIGGAWRTFRGTEVEGYIRSDTTFYPGFSGGPLIDAAGRVIGINSSRLGRGVGLTIPVAAAALVADDLLKSGHVRRPYLGISSQGAKLPPALAARLDGQDEGLLIVTVETDSPADKAGIGIGDILVKFAGSPVTTTESLQSLLGSNRVGTATPVTVLRGGEPRDFTVTVGERG